MGRPREVGVVRAISVTTRMTPGEKATMEATAALRGFQNNSDYVRTLVRDDAARAKGTK